MNDVAIVRLPEGLVDLTKDVYYFILIKFISTLNQVSYKRA